MNSHPSQNKKSNAPQHLFTILFHDVIQIFLGLLLSLIHDAVTLRSLVFMFLILNEFPSDVLFLLRTV